MWRSRLRVAVCAATFALAACGGTAPNAPEATPAEAARDRPAAPAIVSVASVQLGTNLGPDRKIATPATAFAPRDTIIASVSTHTTGDVTAVGELAATWTGPDGAVIEDERRQITFSGPGRTNFEIRDPAGFPTGSYRVDISLDGVSMRRTVFQIR
ncbi:hypothetical protein [Luteimonas cellulosilyticus]|uniref:hypothetical protein n=1 Tax=Luteimonas cellulosilyticus TaxID=2683586 RepID=UPI00135A7122|nr:hypothetical protein [Luteimonas cellulosilyticus]